MKMKSNVIVILTASIIVLLVSMTVGFYAQSFREVSDAYSSENIPSLFPTRIQKQDPARVSSLTLSDDELACSTNDDCTTVPVDCCGCEAGGTVIAINTDSYEARKDDLAIKCSQTACIQVLSTDWSCTSSKLECLEGKCILQNTLSIEN